MTNYDEEMLFEENEFEFESVKIDSKAPSFNLPFYDPKKDNDGKITLKDLKWKWSVLFFYPADFTFVCPTELKDMADQKEKFKELKVKVLAVSTDTIFSHRAWTKHELLMKDFPYKMLADHTGEISEKYNILDHETGMAARWTFIIDPDLNISSSIYERTSNTSLSCKMGCLSKNYNSIYKNIRWSWRRTKQARKRI